MYLVITLLAILVWTWLWFKFLWDIEFAGTVITLWIIVALCICFCYVCCSARSSYTPTHYQYTKSNTTAYVVVKGTDGEDVEGKFTEAVDYNRVGNVNVVWLYHEYNELGWQLRSEVRVERK